MKRLLLISVFALVGCQQSPLTPTRIGSTTRGELLRLPVKADAGSPSFVVGSCKWRTAGVREYLNDDTAVVPTIIDVFGDPSRKVYIEAVYRDQGSTWFMAQVVDYPSPWCFI